MDKEVFDMERELYYLKKERTNLLLKLPERPLSRKVLPYIVWFLAFSAAKFLENWASFYLNGPINYLIFLIFLFIIIFLDLLRAVRKDCILKQVRKYSDKIKILERKMRERKIPE